MDNLDNQISNYVDYCQYQKNLDTKSLKAYRIDLKQFSQQNVTIKISDITTDMLEKYIATLNKEYKPRTVKRKIASIKAFYSYLEYKEYIEKNPFNKVKVKIREPVILPKTIPLYTVETFLATIYKQQKEANTIYQKRNALRDAAVIELLFATGLRISELCSLRKNDINLVEQTVLVYGKGSKERRIQIGNDDVIKVLKEYKKEYVIQIEKCEYFFANQSGQKLSDQVVRRMINKYSSIAAIDLHITPHMFRHTFATSLLEADVDIRYIQEMLGHSSINITQIYTHVAMSKQRDILTTKHPRKNFHI